MFNFKRNLIILDFENSIFLVESINESTNNLNFRKLPLSNNVIVIEENENSVNSFWILTNKGNLLHVKIPTIEKIDKLSTEMLNLNLIQNKIKNTLIEIDETTKIYEIKKKKNEELNNQILSLNSISTLISQKNFNFFKCKSKIDSKSKEVNKIEIEIENQSNLILSNWKSKKKFSLFH